VPHRRRDELALRARELADRIDLTNGTKNLHFNLDGVCSMPCDEAWPKERLELFKQWMDEGLAP
jgi:hypothetical protein